MSALTMHEAIIHVFVAARVELPLQPQFVVAAARQDAAPKTIEKDMAASRGLVAGFWHNIFAEFTVGFLPRYFVAQLAAQVKPIDPNRCTGRRVGRKEQCLLKA